MNRIKFLGIELIILNAILWVMASGLVFLSFSDVGDVSFGLVVMYLILFLVGSLSYIALYLSILRLRKNILSLFAIILVLLFVTYITLRLTLTALAWEGGIILLTVVPFILLILRHLFIKAIVRKR